MPAYQRARCNAVAFLTLAALSGPASAQNPAVTINVDNNLNRHAINPNIYGVAYARQRNADRPELPSTATAATTPAATTGS